MHRNTIYFIYETLILFIIYLLVITLFLFYSNNDLLILILLFFLGFKNNHIINFVDCLFALLGKKFNNMQQLNYTAIKAIVNVLKLRRAACILEKCS